MQLQSIPLPYNSTYLRYYRIFERYELSKISLSRLFSILTDSMTRMVEGLRGLIKNNEVVDDNTVRELREHIKNRLAVGEERVDNHHEAYALSYQ